MEAGTYVGGVFAVGLFSLFTVYKIETCELHKLSSVTTFYNINLEFISIGMNIFFQLSSNSRNYMAYREASEG
jgi:hypothetical protein